MALEETKKQELLEVFKKEMIIRTILIEAMSCKDSRALREVLELSGEYGILEEILNKKITMKQADEQ